MDDEWLIKIREFVQEHPDNGMSLAWNEMLETAEDFTEEDFKEELTVQYGEHKIPARDVAEVQDVFPEYF